MRVFVTGASGFIGSAIVAELVDAGHQVLGLTRSEKGAQALAAAGATAHWGELEDLESLRAGAALADGVIHTAFNHDFSKYKANCEADRQIIRALGAALVGSDRPLVVTSGTAILPLGRLVTEDDVPSSSESKPRAATEQAAAEIAEQGVRVSVVRLPPSVHGDGDHAFVPALIGIAREKGVAAYIGDGSNRWPAVHRLDVAQLFRLALEKGEAGAHYHGNAEEGIPLREIAKYIGHRLNLPVAAVSSEAAEDHFGWLAMFAALDNPTSSALTRERLGWQPVQPGLLDDLDQGRYF